MKTKNVIEGLEILQKYTQDTYAIAAEHDIIFFLVRHDDPSPADQSRLEHLGWFRHDGGNWASFV